MQPPSLYEIALAQCQRYATCIGDIGDLPYHIAKQWLAKLNHDQLVLVEENSPHIRAQSDELWADLIRRDFRDRNVPKHDFRRTYQTYSEDKAAQLGQAWERLKMKQAEYDASRKATSVVALSEEELPLSRGSGAIPNFRSSLMRHVAKKSQASSTFLRKPARLIPPSRRASSPPLAAASAAAVNLGKKASVHPSLLNLRPPPSLANLRANNLDPRAIAIPVDQQLGSPPLSPPATQSASRYLPPNPLGSPPLNSPPLYGSSPPLRSNSPPLQSNSPPFRSNSPPFRSNSPPFRSNSPPLRNAPNPKRRRVASVFMPRR